jgi:hypothetical protein
LTQETLERECSRTALERNWIEASWPHSKASAAMMFWIRDYCTVTVKVVLAVVVDVVVSVPTTANV